MSGKVTQRLAIILLILSSAFFGFVVAGALNFINPSDFGGAFGLPFMQTNPVEFTEGLPEGVDYPLSGPALNESPGDLPILDLVQVAERGKEFVVNIASISTRGESASSGAEGLPKAGTGIVLDGDGYILTNWHVVENSDKVLVSLLNGNRHSARIVGADPDTDLALLKISPRVGLPSAILGDSDSVHPGEWVMAIGHPSGLSHTVTVGVVSAVGRDFDINAAFINFIQTDAAINPGNSGGPLLNRKGEIIGINSAMFRGSQNLGFAIPINLVKLVIGQLRQRGRVQRGYLGLQPEPISEDLQLALGLESRAGALVSNVVRTLENGDTSPAYGAGLRIGDIVTSFDGKRIDGVEKLYILAAYTPPGKTVKVGVLRNGARQTFDVTLAPRPSEQPVMLPSIRQMSGRFPLGLKVAPIDDGSRRRIEQLTGGEFTDGVAVVDVEVGSNAYDKGIAPGDIITSVGGRSVADAEDFQRAVESASESGEFVVVYLIRPSDETHRRFIAVQR